MFNLEESSGLVKKLIDEENCSIIKTMSEVCTGTKMLLIKQTIPLTCIQLLPSVTKKKSLNKFFEIVARHSPQTGGVLRSTSLECYRAVEMCALGKNYLTFFHSNAL